MDLGLLRKIFLLVKNIRVEEGGREREERERESEREMPGFFPSFLKYYSLRR